MRRTGLAVLILSVLGIALGVPAVMAEPKPTTIPHEVLPTDTEFAAAFGAARFDDLWVELNGDPAAFELPQGDAGLRGPVDIGFTFQFMNGPVGYREVSWWVSGVKHTAVEAYLTDSGYDRLWVSSKGLVLFADPVNWDYALDCPTCTPQPRGSWNWYPRGFDPIPPNNFIAPFFNDLLVGSNGIFGPRGRMLAKTVGDAGQRKFVVEWYRVRNSWTGNQVTFQLQLCEGSNSILFLYKDFVGRGHGVSGWLVVPSLLIGMEDTYGKTYLGTVYVPWGLPAPFNWLNQNSIIGHWVYSPVARGDMIGFVY